MTERRLSGGARAAVVAGTLATAAALVLVPAAAAQARPAADQEMPFVCGEEWYGSTRSSHSPSYWSVDWNREDDLGRRVVASASGVVSRVRDLGGSSYGLYVMVDHGAGESTLYAHLLSAHVVEGQHLDQGQLIGRVGTSGGSTGPHLHYEQRRGSTVQVPWFHDVEYDFFTTLASQNCVDVPIAGDWDGDGRDEVGTYRRGAGGRFLRDGAGRVRFGLPVDDPLVGDWDGDGTSDLGVRRPRERRFILRTADGARSSLRLSGVGARGVAGDWDGDGRTDVGVYRPAAQVFRLRNGDGSAVRVDLGAPAAVPVTGDWDGDGRTDLGLFTAGTWTLWFRDGAGATGTVTVALGDGDDLPVTGDWNGNGVTDLGVWDPETATFTLRRARALSTNTGRLRVQVYGEPR